MNDRRRINGPAGSTTAPLYCKANTQNRASRSSQSQRTRPPNTLRNMFLKTGVTPSASGSAYLEMEASPAINSLLRTTSTSTSGLKLICAVHGPRPLPRSAPFSPHIILSSHVKYAPFATRQRRGYTRDSSERDLSVHVETALRGVIIGERWPKSGVDIVITILEGEEDYWSGASQGSAKTGGQWGIMSILSGCITVASAAIVHAGIDCVDTVSGGAAALVRQPGLKEQPLLVLDPVPSEHEEIMAMCTVGYLPSRDEVTGIWVKGDMTMDSASVDGAGPSAYEVLLDGAMQAALGSHHLLSEALREAAHVKR